MLSNGCNYDTKDDAGHRPTEIVSQFIENVRANDYQKAFTYWHPDGIRRIEKSYSAKFEAFCQESIACDSFALEIEGGDSGYLWIYMNGRRQTEDIRFRFFLKETDGRWQLF